MLFRFIWKTNQSWSFLKGTWIKIKQIYSKLQSGLRPSFVAQNRTAHMMKFLPSKSGLGQKTWPDGPIIDLSWTVKWLDLVRRLLLLFPYVVLPFPTFPQNNPIPPSPHPHLDPHSRHLFHQTIWQLQCLCRRINRAPTAPAGHGSPLRNGPTICDATDRYAQKDVSFFC